VRMGKDPKFGNSIPNAWMASSPGHPFFWLTLSYVSENSQHWRGSVEALTGPIALHKQVNIYQQTDTTALSRAVQKSPLGAAYDATTSQLISKEHKVILLNETLIYPYSWYKDGRPFKYICEFNEFGFDPLKCQEMLKTKEHGSYTITYWSHSWTRTGHHDSHLQNAG